MVESTVSNTLWMQIIPVDEEVEETERRESNQLPLPNIHHAAHLLLPFLDELVANFLLRLVLESLVATVFHFLHANA